MHYFSCKTRTCICVHARIYTCNRCTSPCVNSSGYKHIWGLMNIYISIRRSIDISESIKLPARLYVLFFEVLRVVLDVVVDEGGDEPVAVIVIFLKPQIKGVLVLLASLSEIFTQELIGVKIIGEACECVHVHVHICMHVCMCACLGIPHAHASNIFVWIMIAIYLYIQECSWVCM